MLAAMLVAMVAGVDLAMWRLRHRLLLAAVVAVWVGAVVVLGVLVAGVSVWGAAIAALLAAGWAGLKNSIGADAAAGLVIVGAAGLVLGFDDSGAAASVVAAAAAAVFLAHSANEVCRDVIRRARIGGKDEAGGGAPSEGEPSRLKGGRFIGPLERWMIAGLALVGAQAVIVGVMAAKGIGRFPEISGDRGRGAAAEEFLVGSLVSWALAGAAALLVASLR